MTTMTANNHDILTQAVTLPRIGDAAPDFKAPTTHGEITFSDWQGSDWVILFSHPAQRRRGREASGRLADRRQERRRVPRQLETRRQSHRPAAQNRDGGRGPLERLLRKTRLLSLQENVIIYLK